MSAAGAAARGLTGGFSLIEIVMVVALVSVAASLVILNANAFLSGLGDKPPPENFQMSVREARFQAAATRDVVTLMLEPESGDFVIFSDAQGELHRRPSGFGADVPVNAFELHRILPSAGTGPLDNRRRERVESIQFHPDRASTPFQVNFRHNWETLEQIYDPFSDLVVEERR